MTTLLVPFQFTTGGRAAVTNDARQVAEQQIVDILVTGHGERVMRPEYGAGVASHLFDPLDELVLADAAQEAMTRMGNINTAIVQSINVVPFADPYHSAGGAASTVEVIVHYTLPAQPTLYTVRQPITTYINAETGL